MLLFSVLCHCKQSISGFGTVVGRNKIYEEVSMDSGLIQEIIPRLHHDESTVAALTFTLLSVTSLQGEQCCLLYSAAGEKHPLLFCHKQIQ